MYICKWMKAWLSDGKWPLIATSSHVFVSKKKKNCTMKCEFHSKKLMKISVMETRFF